MRALYTLTIFLGSALLFLVQPMVAKMILPVFGGSPNVWATAMVFFQAMLLFGYAYAHGSFRLLGPRRQPIVHLVLLAAALLALPIGLSTAYSPAPSAQPAPQVLLLLLAMVGLPFFVVSSQAPLMQRWFADTPDPRAADPYFLYSASNVGSLLALASYPLLLEPSLRLAEQSRLWTILYATLAVLTFLCAVVLWRTSKGVAEHGEAANAPAPTFKERLRWVLLAAVPSSLLLGVTTHVTTNIAPVPLLWIVPLGLYLVTFIFAFASKPLVGTVRLTRIAMGAAILMALVIGLDMLNPIAIPIHLFGFFFVAWACHALLSASRPSAGRLTEFFLWMSLGGVLGGAFNALLAPVLFNRVWEYPIAVALAVALLPRKRVESLRLGWPDAVFLGSLALAGLGMVLLSRSGTSLLGAESNLRYVIVLGLLAALAYGRSLRLAAALGLVMAIGPVIRLANANVLFADRSFFAPMRVTAAGQGGISRALAHGNILHGKQLMTPELRRKPITYYHPIGPIGQVFQETPAAKRRAPFAVVGLGIGTLAAWASRGQEVDLYEIDPLVVQIANDTRLFTYLADSRATLATIVGDARLKLKEAPQGRYGLIFLDAFSSDAVPVHLLTVEAIGMYLEKLQPGGVLVFNTTNRYLRIDRVLRANARSLGLSAIVRADVVEDNDPLQMEGKTDSRWLLMARRKEDFGVLAVSPLWQETRAEPNPPVWTDDFSNVVQVFEP